MVKRLSLVAGFAILAVASGSSAQESPDMSCNRPVFLVGFDTIDIPPGGTAEPAGLSNFVRRPLEQGRAEPIIDNLPDLTYEKTTDWLDVSVTRWPCEEKLRAAWAEAQVKPPRPIAGRIFVAGIFNPAPIDDGGVPSDMMPNACASPFLLIGFNTITDPVKYAVYREALTASKLAFRHGFRRIFAGTPKSILAGRWPDDTTVTLSVWPCREAFEKFHGSDAYHKGIYPLRVGTSRYRLVAYSFGRHQWPHVGIR